MSTYARIADLPLLIDDYALDVRALSLGPDFRRLTTVIHLRGGSHEGLGEDVGYEPRDHEAQMGAGPVLPLAGAFTLESFSRHLDALDLFHAGPPGHDAFRDYRRWAFESAALDLALRQAGASLADALGLVLSPVRFVVSTRLDPPGADRVTRWLDRDPTLRFKLDPTDEWPDTLIDELAARGVVEVMDMKGQYPMDDLPFEVPVEPRTYSRIVAAFPNAFIEDPRLDPPALRETLRGHEGRVTWDAPIHSVADVLAREWPPTTINVKPSRCGPVRTLLDLYDHLGAAGIGAYAGGQTELGPGRGQVQYLASLFHPDAPNDIAPSGYNDPEPPDALPSSPLPVAASAIGFRWES